MILIRTNSYKIRYILLACLLFFVQSCFLLQAQRVRSGKSSIRINNIKAEEKIITDKTPPILEIISPDFGQKEKVKSHLPEITIIGKVTDRESGINKIYINSKECKLADDGLFVEKILLKKGDNKINIIAIDNEDNYYEEDLIIEHVIESELVTTQLSIAGEYYALLIGVDEYEDPSLMDLDNPARDAENLYNVLVSDYYFNRENVTLIKNAKRHEITDALDYLAERLTKDDNLMIFYAGHGWWDKKANVGYWLPSDARLSRKADWFRNSTLCDYLKEIDSKHTLLITDACFGGAIFKTRSVSMEAPKAIQMLYDLPSRKAMTSGTLTEVPDRSTFVKYLIERLSENKDKYISSEQLFSSFRIAVINNSDVIPQYGEIRNVGDEGGDFIFIKKD
jgi:hypothetical protein